MCCFSPAAFNISSLALLFAILVTMSWYGLLFVWDSVFQDAHFFSQVSNVFSQYVFKCILCPFLSFFPSWDPQNSNVSMLDVVPEVSETDLISFYSFFLFGFSDLHYPVSQVIDPSLCIISPSIEVYFSFHLLYSSALFGSPIDFLFLVFFKLFY